MYHRHLFLLEQIDRKIGKHKLQNKQENKNVNVLNAYGNLNWQLVVCNNKKQLFICYLV